MDYSGGSSILMSPYKGNVGDVPMESRNSKASNVTKQEK